MLERPKLTAMVVHLQAVVRDDDAQALRYFRFARRRRAFRSGVKPVAKLLSVLS